MSKRIELPKKEDDGADIDYLEEDPELPNQRYIIVSFISPEKIIKQKEMFYFEKFVQWVDYDWKVTGMEHFVAFMAQKYSIKVEDVMADVRDFEKTHKADLKKSDLHEKYQVFLLNHEKELQAAYDKEVSFQCNTRGVKCRRAFPSYEEAQLWAKVLQRKYPKDNIVIGKMGCWLPWDPSDHLMDNVEYSNAQLNEIMRKYKENESNRELFFAEERELAIKTQKDENAKRKAETATVMSLGPVHPSERPSER